MPFAKSIVPWVMSQVPPCVCRSLVRLALNWKFESVGTVAVTGVSVTEMPESIVKTLVAVFFVSAAAVAVMVTSKMQIVAVELPQLVPVIFLGSGTV